MKFTDIEFGDRTSASRLRGVLCRYLTVKKNRRRELGLADLDTNEFIHLPVSEIKSIHNLGEKMFRLLVDGIARHGMKLGSPQISLNECDSSDLPKAIENLKDAERKYNRSLDESNRLFQQVVFYRQEIRRMTCLGELAPKVYPVEVA